MGVNWHHVKTLMSLRKQGVQLGDVLTIGRQNLFISPWELRRLLGREPELLDRYSEFMEPHPTYAEPLFKLLGAGSVASMDASDYEGATVIHDQNTPVTENLKRRFDLVDDGGTIEHIFNLPVALKNLMEMTKVGGHLLIDTMANSCLGHGFYQLSPELFYRALAKNNGFEVRRMILYPMYDRSTWYEVADPETVRSRVELASGHRMGIWVLARRTADVPIFASPPQQSDYANIQWHQRKPDNAPSKFLVPPNPLREGAKATLRRIAPRLFQRLLHRKVIRETRRFSLEAQPKFYRPING